jgi:hypothetical protein
VLWSVDAFEADARRPSSRHFYFFRVSCVIRFDASELGMDRESIDNYFKKFENGKNKRKLSPLVLRFSPSCPKYLLATFTKHTFQMDATEATEETEAAEPLMSNQNNTSSSDTMASVMGLMNSA